MPESSLNVISTAFYRRASRLWGWSLTGRWLAFIVGGITIFYALRPGPAAVITLLLSLLTEIASLRSSSYKEKAEYFKRLFEFEQSLGIKAPRSEFGKIVPRYFLKGLDSFSNELLTGFEFASTKPPSTQRLLENLRESSWWTSNLARVAAFQTWVLLGIFILSAFALLIAAVEFTSGNTHTQLAGQVAIALILGIFSLGLLPRALDFSGLSKAAEDTWRKADDFLERQDFSEVSVILLMGEYQIARASAPMVPSSIWRKNKDRLNNLYTNQFSNDQ